MATKLSYLQLDMETGDACMEDAYIAEAKGRINVSHAIFEAAYKNYELPDDGQFVCYVESADAGIPTKSKDASGTACAAVFHELNAYFDAIVSTAKKAKAAAEKDLKTLIAIGKKVGVNMSENFEGGFAAPLGKAIVSGGRLNLSADKFVNSRNACKIAKAYVKGSVYSLAAYGISITEEMNAVVKNFTGCGSVSGTIKSLKDLESKLSDGGRAFAVGNAAEKTTDSVKAGDITDFALAVYSVAVTADAIIKVATDSAKKHATAMMKSFCGDECKDGKISRTCEAINNDIQKYMGNLEECGKAVSTAFTDSAYALLETISK